MVRVRRASGQALLALLCLVPGRARAQSASTPAASPEWTCRVVVSPRGARLVFPIRSQGVWEWNKSETPVNAAEYRWIIEVVNEGQTLQAGFFNFKQPASQPQQGGIRSLLDSGQKSVAKREPTGFAVDSRASIEFSDEPGMVVGVIVDAATRDMLFSGRPPRALCLAQTPGAELIKAETEITYEPPAPPKAADAELLRTITALDGSVFDAYNRCDLVKLGSYFAEDLEFYHDQGGLTRTRQGLLEAVKNNICGKVRRELVAGTLEVYPMHGFGAVEMGVHRFHHPGRDDVEPVGEAKFIHLWQQKDGAWIITRVISYDHHALAR